MDSVRGIYQTTLQAASSIAGPVIDTFKSKFTGVADVTQNYALPILTQKSYADPLVQLSRSTAIDDRKSHLAKILGDYAQNRRDANLKDQSKINTTMVKLVFHKMTMSQDPSSGAEGSYHKCVNEPTVRNFDVAPELVYDHLLRSAEPRDHPQGISSLAFAFAAILALSVHREGTPPSNLKYNKTSPYFDLSPLYGENEIETNSIRTKDGRGMLWPDCFTEERLDRLPDSVPALLVLWNRYHNYVAKQLLSFNEHNEWKDPNDLTCEESLTQDNEIFHIAKSITCIHFINVVREDFLKGLIGMPMVGLSAQVDILYDVRGLTNDKAGYLSSVESYLLYSFSSFAPSSFASEVHVRLKKKNEASVNPDVTHMRRYNRLGNLGRSENGYFEDNDLAELLFHAVETKAGSPGGRAVLDWAREESILKLRQARQANVCTLNEFRQHLGLKPLQSFEEWNPKLANAARDIYDDINNLELYPGLLCESSEGSGFGFGYTMSWGLMADIVTRIRCDPMFTSQFKEHLLTKWGYNDCIPSHDHVKETNLTFYNTGGSLGGMLPKLFQRTLPYNCPYDNVYCLFPFVIPDKSKEYIKDQTRYDVDRPKQAKIKVLGTLEAIQKVLEDPKKYPSPYKQNLIELTGGYGHMLGFDYLPLHDRDFMLTLFSLMPDKGAARRIGEYFAEKAEKSLQLHAYVGYVNVASIDVVEDVIDATCIRWVCETMYNFDFKEDSIMRMSKSEIAKALIQSKEIKKKERDNCAAYHAYIFCYNEPEFGWNVRERALTASTELRRHIKEQISRHRDESSGSIYEYLMQLVQEHTLGILVPQHSGFTFLDRMIKASQLKSLRELENSFLSNLERKAFENNTTHLSDLGKRCKKEALKELRAVNMTFAERIRKDGLLKSLMHHFFEVRQFSGYELQEIADQKFEEQRVIANVIGLGIMMIVHFSKACAQAVDFYLDDKRSDERKMLEELCRRDANSSNEEIMKYIWEALGNGQRLGVWRNMSLNAGDTRAVEQDRQSDEDLESESDKYWDSDESDEDRESEADAQPQDEDARETGEEGQPDVITIEPGDRIFADFSSTTNDPNQIEKPEDVQVDPSHALNSLLGLGLHKCPAKLFLEQTMPEIFRVIFKQKDLKRANGRKGQLNSTSLRPNAAPWDSEIYLTEDGSFNYYPRQMVIEFNSSGLQKQKSVDRMDVTNGNKLIMIRGCTVIVIIILLIIMILHVFSLLVGRQSPTPPLAILAQTKTQCEMPLMTIEDWHIRTFRPEWFGLFGEPAPIIYRTPWRRKAHQISVVDLDKRDIELSLWVGKEYVGSRDVELNSTVDCGEDIGKCLELDFASALFVVPPGRHTVRAEIRKRNASEAFIWGKARRRRVMWLVQRCA